MIYDLTIWYLFLDADKQDFSHLINGQVSYTWGKSTAFMVVCPGYHGGRHYPALSALFSYPLRRTKRVYSRDTLYRKSSVVLAVVIFGYQAFAIAGRYLIKLIRYDSTKFISGKPDLAGFLASQRKILSRDFDICLKDKYRQLALDLRYSGSYLLPPVVISWSMRAEMRWLYPSHCSAPVHFSGQMGICYPSTVCASNERAD